MIFDTKITNARIVDGTGRPAYSGEIGIKDGEIIALTPSSLFQPAVHEYDAAGSIVAPGFIDIHTHYDAQVLWDRGCSVSSWHGVTTVILGNCGFGVAPTRRHDRRRILETLQIVEGMSIDVLEAGVGPDWPCETFPAYLDAIEAGLSINIGILQGHTPLRLFVMGDEAVERDATEAEIGRMEVLLGQAMQAGALGFATSKSSAHFGYGGKPVPSRLASKEEVVRLTRVAGAKGGLLQITYLPDPVDLDLLDEYFQETGARITWTALLAGANPVEKRRALQARTAELLSKGHFIVPQVTNRPIVFEFDFEHPFIFEMLPAFNELARAKSREVRLRALADPVFRQRFRDEMPAFQRGWWDRAVISHNPLDPSQEERPLSAVAADMNRHPLDYSLDLAIETDLKSKYRAAMVNYDEAEVAELLRDTNNVLGLSDAGAHASQMCDACQPTDLLGRWVREKGVLGLERAVQMLTSRPAEVVGIKDRGTLKVGNAADIVIFDPERVGASPLRRMKDLPGGGDRLISEAIGIEMVMVNGTIIRKDNTDQEQGIRSAPGQVLRHGAGRRH